MNTCTLENWLFVVWTDDCELVNRLHPLRDAFCGRLLYPAAVQEHAPGVAFGVAERARVVSCPVLVRRSKPRLRAGGPEGRFSLRLTRRSPMVT